MFAFHRPLFSSFLFSTSSNPAAPPAATPKLDNFYMPSNFLTGTNAHHFEFLYSQWEADPSTVDPSYHTLFDNIKSGHDLYSGTQIPEPKNLGLDHGISVNLDGKSMDETYLRQSFALQNLKSAYRTYGSMKANLDPLGLCKRSETPNYKDFGFKDSDLEKEILAVRTDFSHGFNLIPTKIGTLIKKLEDSYCGNYSVEYKHIQTHEEQRWIMNEIEDTRPNFSSDQKVHIYSTLARARLFEDFLGKKLGSAKRFGVEGCESLLVAFDQALQVGAEKGLKDVHIGMSHRGRLNVLAHILDMKYQRIFNEFHDIHANVDENTAATLHTSLNAGDVKYHLGDQTTRIVKTPGGDIPVTISLSANPSHLEHVNPVVAGKTRAAIQFNQYDPQNCIPILVHGDAAFAGQGLVTETLQLCNLDDYSTFGTLHFVVNNQIGFTTLPENSRSSRYSGDVARLINAPIFMVNANDPEAVAYVTDVAMRFRQKFFKDVVVEIVGYRLNGHNESDEPMFTQPLLYSEIKKQVPAHESFEKHLLSSNHATKKQLKQVRKAITNELNDSWSKKTQAYETNNKEWLESRWGRFFKPHELEPGKVPGRTGISDAELQRVGKALISPPPNFKVHRVVEQKIEKFSHMLEGTENVDWALAESLAFGSLMTEGSYVRLSGQDAQRGTFSHRHSVWHCQETGNVWTPLNHIEGVKVSPRPSNPLQHQDVRSIDYLADTELYDLGKKFSEQKVVPDTRNPVRFDVCNSPLSEAGVLGFEHGFSLYHPEALVIMEGQFGDFLNTAQAMIDTFVVAGETKWIRQSGLVMMLPHGYEGQGAEHSSARLERFLQLGSAPIVQGTDRHGVGLTVGHYARRVNIHVVHPSTPANLFHVLRKQIHSYYYGPNMKKWVKYRKPLILMTPKSLLTHPLVRSSLEDFNLESQFQPLIEDGTHLKYDLVPKKNIRRVLWCSGKIFYNLFEEREKRGINDIAIHRLEMIHPFPFTEVAELARQYPSDTEHVWVQEEPENMGAWLFVKIRWNNWCGDSVNRLLYVGRGTAAAPATGSPGKHKEEVELILNGAFGKEKPVDYYTN